MDEGTGPSGLKHYRSVSACHVEHHGQLGEV